MSKLPTDGLDHVEDDFTPSELEQVVGGRGPTTQTPVHAEALLHDGFDAHATTEANNHHHSASAVSSPAHHVDLHGWLGLTGHSIDDAVGRLDHAFAELTTNQSAHDIDSHIQLGRAISSHISSGNHPYTFGGIDSVTLAHLPHASGQAVHQPHLPDHRGGPSNAPRATASATPSPRSTPVRQS